MTNLWNAIFMELKSSRPIQDIFSFHLSKFPDFQRIPFVQLE